MKRYTGLLDADTQEKIKGRVEYLKGLNADRSGLKRAALPTYTIDETVQKYNAGISKDEIKAWVWFRKKQGVPMTSWKSYFVKETPTLLLNWVKNGILFQDPTNGGLVPYAVFAFGNIYTKLSKLAIEREDIVQAHGASVYENHVKILESIKPTPLSISNPIEGERPVILAISEFPKRYLVKNLNDASGVILDQEMTLLGAFETWLKSQSSDVFKGSSAFNIISFYLEAERKPRNIDKVEWGKMKKVTRELGEKLFKKFLYEALESSDRLRIDAHYNSQYNSTAKLQYHKIPIGIEVSRTFMGNSLEVRAAQREGIAFMELVGSGIIAYDVGVGKTITALIEMVTAIKNGKCKRPIVAVPNPTYKNWMKEMLGEGDLAGVLSGTGITVNDWYNLGTKYDHVKLDRKVPENSVTLVSYEGLMKIGFNDSTQEDHFENLSTIVGQSSEASDRDKEQQNQKFREIIGVGRKETIADIEDLGFDYVVVDEAHNFKNIFSEVKSEKGGQKHFHVQGGKPSNRGVKLFFLCNYIQRRYGRNVMLLTATPFTNSPLEIYSMLSLVAFQYMKDNNILNLKQFFEQYIAETTEYVVGVDGDYTQRNVVKSFNNRISLQKLINSHINFKTGEEAGVPRPCKINLPLTTRFVEGKGVVRLERKDQSLTYLQAGEDQKEIQAEINKLAQMGADRDDPGRLLSLMADSQNNALSPFLVGKSPQSHVSHMDKGTPIDYKDFVESSPKILYALECIRTVKEHHEKTKTPVSGQVIYIDRGKAYFKYIKEYLEQEIGYKKSQPIRKNSKQTVDEVEFVQGGMPAAKKEMIKDAFNAGVVKVIIGTSTIKEGINLQERSSVLYNLYPNWNPTDIRQLEGRIWRQKNQFNFVRVVMPLMENSMDVFVFQKLEEKTSRINDLWSQVERGNVLDEESLDPNEVKFALVTDMGVLLRHELNLIKEELKANHHILSTRIDDLQNLNDLEQKYQLYKGNVVDDIRSFSKRISTMQISYDNGVYLSFNDLPNINIEDQTKAIQMKIERFQRANDMLTEVAQGNDDDKLVIRAYSAYNRINGGYHSTYYFDMFKDTVSSLAKIKRTLFQSRGLSEDTDVEKIKAEMQQELEEVSAEIDEVNTDEFKEKITKKLEAKKAKFGVTGVEVEQRVEEFVKLNHLLNYRFDKKSARACTFPDENNFIAPAAKKQMSPALALKVKIAKAKAIAIQINLKRSRKKQAV